MTAAVATSTSTATFSGVGASNAASLASAGGAASFAACGGVPTREFSAVHTDLLTDTLYGVAGLAVVPVTGGSTAVGRWRSKRIMLPEYVGLGWARVNGELSSGVVLRLYANGLLHYTTPSITTRMPVRLPTGKAKRWEVEVESADLVTSVLIATTVEELT